MKLRYVFLDTTPLALYAKNASIPLVVQCKQWLAGLQTAGVRIIVPELADYEARREMLRKNATAQLAELDALIERTEYLPITTDAMREASRLWAVARQGGYATASPDALDGDVIIAAQALLYARTRGLSADEYTVATGNAAHLSHYAPAGDWQAVAVA